MGVHYRWPYGVLTALYCAGIFYWSSQPVLDVPPSLIFPGVDKVVHAVVFGGLAGLVCLGLWRSNGTLIAPILFWGPVAFVFLYSLFDEVHQLFVPFRTFDWLDIAADVGGALAVQGVLAGWLLPRISKK